MKPDVVAAAHDRLKPHITRTPILQSQLLNRFLGADIFFKYEGAQKVGAFKARGALNTLLHLKERHKMPLEVVAYSSGNHAQAVAWAARQMGLGSTIVIPAGSSKVKIAATKAYGAEVVIAKTRQAAEDIAKERSHTAGSFLLPPYDHDDVIAGQGTAALEAWHDEKKFDAVFAPCGGGGLISGTYLATRLFSKEAAVYAAEPAVANDAARSYNTGKIYRFRDTPKTIADGARTLGISERTFHYIDQLDGFYEISETEILYWSQWLMHLLKVTVEPTAALGMAGAHKWIQEGHKKKRILVILSGANLDSDTYAKIWAHDHLSKLPAL
ncbi:MAG: serine/threonine dehydratase [Alphaproteobacteria bacterium]|nr:MAG: serine/threonine dehydratase [Alphaproteobacteria bacterium]